MDIPFLFRDYAHARKTMDGPIGQDLLKKMQSRGLVGLAWTENGFRHMTNSKRAIVKADDASGLKMRTMENKVHMDGYKTFGILPTPMAFPELFTALQQGTVDGQENPIPVILASKFAQVQKHLSLTGHVYSPAVILLSPKVWDKLSDADKKAFVAAAQKGAEAQRKKVNDDENNGIAQLRKDGMQVVEKVDGDSFRKAVAPAYASLKSPAWFLLGVNAALFVIGMFIETSAAIIVLAPILVPVALHLGIDPVHFGMIMVVNLALGMITPPFGVNLFAACTVAQISLDRIVRHLSAFVAVVVGCLMVVTYVPALSLTLRDLVYAPAAPVLMPTPSSSSAAPASIAPQ